MVGANWSREELLAMTHAWGEALEVPPHRGFRLLEHMFRRFTELCGGATKRTVGSMEIKRKYMKNMAEVITQYDNALEQRMRGGGTGGGNQHGLHMHVPWFEMKRSERKEWFLRLNTKSYKFANIDEETYYDVQQLMQVERVVYGVDSVLDEDEERGERDHHEDKKDEDNASSSGDHPRIRVPLTRNSAGYWETATYEGRSRPGATGFSGWTPSRTGGVSREPRQAARRRGNDAFDRLIGSISGGGDTVMIAAGPWDNDSDSESDSSIGDEDDDGDGYNWRQAKHMASLHFQNEGEEAPGKKRSRTIGSVDFGSDTASHVSSFDGDDDGGSVASLRGEQQQQQPERTTDPEFLRAVHSLEAHADELKELLIQERDERRQQQQQWTSETQRRERERQEATELISQTRATQVVDQQVNITRNEALALLRSEEEARRQDDETLTVEQDDENQLMKELKRDAEDRVRFNEALRETRDEENAFVQNLQQEQPESHRRRAECMELMKEIKLIRGKDEVMSEGDLEPQSSGGQAEADDSVKQASEALAQNQDTGTSRAVRRSSAPSTDRKGADSVMSPLRTRSGQVRAKGNSRP